MRGQMCRRNMWGQTCMRGRLSSMCDETGVASGAGAEIPSEGAIITTATDAGVLFHILVGLGVWSDRRIRFSLFKVLVI